MPAKKILLCAFLFLAPFLVRAQYEDLIFEDYDYKENIKSVQFRLNGLLLSRPIIELNSGERLALAFDDMDGDVKNYVYTIIHCNRDWQPSNLATFEFLEGFPEDDLNNYDFSFNTKVFFTHFWLTLPNDDMKWTKSGNYLLVVYENDDEKIPVITRRFVVVEPVVHFYPNFSFPTDQNKFKTHQELDFKISTKGAELKNPRFSVNTTIIQNGNWNTAISDIPPFFLRNDTLMEFDYQDKIVFPAGREWRFLDLRSLRNPNQEFVIERFDDGYYVTLLKDKKRAIAPHLTITDINGSFIIKNWDFQSRIPSSGESDILNINSSKYFYSSNNSLPIELQVYNLQSDYVRTLFSLDSPTEYQDADVYLFGAFTNWKLKDEFKMAYNNQINGYVASILLKQGYYNYVYALVDRKTGKVSFEDTEGNWYETENDYTILAYYRPFGERYDRVIGAFNFKSFR